MLYILALPLLIFLSFKSKYKQSIPARFFLFNNPKFKTEDGVWFHVCSLGEARALKPIIDSIQEKVEIKITTITQTGQLEAQKYSAEVRYLPFEIFLPFWMKKQKLLIILEAEFWFILIIWAYFTKTKIILLNARISDRSVKKYLKLAWFYKKMLQKVDIIYTQSEIDKERFLALGAKNIEVIGNIKLAGEIKITKEYNHLKDEIIVAGSTHNGEEDAILKAFIRYKKFNQKSKLIIVPRHPERFEDVDLLIDSYISENSLKKSRFSKIQSFDADITLIDAMGELNNIYKIADIAILGGAFEDNIGGHNPLEPAKFGCKIITGKYFFHQKELFKYVKNVQYVDKENIYEALQLSKDFKASFVDEKINLEPIIDKILKI